MHEVCRDHKDRDSRLSRDKWVLGLIRWIVGLECQSIHPTSAKNLISSLHPDKVILSPTSRNSLVLRGPRQSTTKCPACRSFSTTCFMPLMMGGWGVIWAQQSRIDIRNSHPHLHRRLQNREAQRASFRFSTAYSIPLDQSPKVFQPCTMT